MELIDELESGARGHYTGSIGIFPDCGGLELNIAIRTVTLAAGLARVHVGGGIVADSDPEAEYIETLDKGAAIFRALQPSAP
jgi:anthranilate/para-aminobenzoate synthase component I